MVDVESSLESSRSKRGFIFTKDVRTLEILISIPLNQRSSDDISLLKECLLKVKYFTNFIGSISYPELIKYLVLEKGEVDRIIFREGDYADSFYIILRGSIGIFIGFSGGEADLVISNEENRGEEPASLGLKKISTLISGDSFGELGFSSNDQRNSYAICLEPTSLLVIRRQIFEKYLSSTTNSKANIYSQFYQEVWELRDAKETQRQEIAKKSISLTCQKKQMIILQGEIPKGIFFVKFGTVKILASFVQDKRTIHVQLDEIERLGSFGEQAALSGTPINYSALSDTECEILIISGEDFSAALTPKLLDIFQSQKRTYPSLRMIQEQYNENQLWKRYVGTLSQSMNNEFTNKLRAQKGLKCSIPFLPKINLGVQFQLPNENLSKRSLNRTKSNETFQQMEDRLRKAIPKKLDNSYGLFHNNADIRSRSSKNRGASFHQDDHINESVIKKIGDKLRAVSTSSERVAPQKSQKMHFFKIQNNLSDTSSADSQESYGIHRRQLYQNELNNLQSSRKRVSVNKNQPKQYQFIVPKFTKKSKAYFFQNEIY